MNETHTKAIDDGQKDLEGLMGLDGEVRGLDLGEVAELGEEDDAKGGGDLCEARRGLFALRLALAALLGRLLLREEQVRRTAQEQDRHDDVLRRARAAASRDRRRLRRCPSG